MRRRLNFVNTRSVAFGVQTYAVDTVRKRTLRHRIYASHNTGFAATPSSLSGKTGINATQIPNRERLKQSNANRNFMAKQGGNLVWFGKPFESQALTEENAEGVFAVPASLGNVKGFDTLEGRLVIICSYGFATLEVAYEAEGFDLRVLARTYKEVLGDSAHVLGDSIFALTPGGMIHVKTNGVVTLLDIDISGLDLNWDFKSEVRDNRYFLDMPDKVLVIEKFFDSFFYVSKTSSSKVWESDWFSLSYGAARQWLKQIRLVSTEDSILTAFTEGRAQKMTLKGSLSMQQININLKGESFKIRIESESEEIRVTELVAVIAFGRAN